ncbi:restriction endonuclease [Neptunomonas phycophila]|uniref:restriction endonuclease n=1 Tax=Neptunomonas phycophila TaxID=1572645 RepID=UPI001BE715B0|nr:restriction endonuclease [Neptunomonas phycophila]
MEGKCKHWKIRKVGVAVIRELYGVMASVDVSDGVIVTSGEFTEEAEALSKEKALTLISGDELSKMLGRKVL